MSNVTTSHALANITDAGLFERLATAVLREADPTYSRLTHPGVNVAGKTVKAPLDGVCFVPAANPPHMIAVHHTIAARDGLKKKWLHDPSKVEPRKSKPTAPAGDIVKTAELVELERARTPDLAVTLILTTNEEPCEALIRDVYAEGRHYGINIDLWSRSRLVHFLENEPSGQWIRYSYLKIEQEQLSSELLHKLSKTSLDIRRPAEDPETWISRKLDTVLSNALHRDVTFVVGGSGLGKSVACYRQLSSHVENGRFGIILPHEVLAASVTLEQAVIAELRQLHPALANVGSTPSRFCSSTKPFLVVVEDINKSGQARSLLKKIAEWSQVLTNKNQKELPYWRLFCPLWPEILPSLSSQERKNIQSLIIMADNFTEVEGSEAIMARARLDKRHLSESNAGMIARSLGNDPLLIALYNFDKVPDASQTIGQFIGDSLSRIAEEKSEYLDSAYFQAIRLLGREILIKRQIDLRWDKISSWEGLQGEPIRQLQHLVHKGELIRQTGSSSDKSLVFRHDRVRDWILADAATDLEDQGLLEEDILADPYFAEVMGAALIQKGVSSVFLQRVLTFNPLALFYSFRTVGEAEKPYRAAILQAINTWLGEQTTHKISHTHLRFEALAILAETDASEVYEIVEKFQDKTISGTMAKLRNGDVYGGIEFCSLIEPGYTARWRDSLIEHVKIKHGNSLAESLEAVLTQENLSTPTKVGSLRLAGHLAKPRLASAIERCWETDDKRNNYIDEYLWAFAQCCADNPTRFLQPVCDAWAELSNEPEHEILPSPRDSISAYELRFAFRQWPPGDAAINYFIQRGAQENLRSSITCMLHGMDHPKAIEFVVNEFAGRERKLGRTDFDFPMRIEDDWRHTQGHWKPMSRESRELLSTLWQNTENDTCLRSTAFSLWSVTTGLKDIEILQNANSIDGLTDSILRQRLIRGDLGAIPPLIEKLSQDNQGFWWQLGTYIWSPELSQALDELLGRRSSLAERVWGECSDLDWVVTDLISSLTIDEAEKILIKHWVHLRFCFKFVQTALYISTPKLLELVEVTIGECPDPSEMFKLISLHFGIKRGDHPGIRDEAQVIELTPYLHFLSPYCINAFWQECNIRGWFSTRRKLLDNLLQPPYLQYMWQSDLAILEMDAMVKEDNLWRLEGWLDGFIKNDVSWQELLTDLRLWLNERQSFESLNLVATAIQHQGSRIDLDMLRDYPTTSDPRVAELIEDSEFVVKRRSIV